MEQATPEVTYSKDAKEKRTRGFISFFFFATTAWSSVGLIMVLFIPQKESMLETALWVYSDHKLSAHSCKVDGHQNIDNLEAKNHAKEPLLQQWIALHITV